MRSFVLAGVVVVTLAGCGGGPDLGAASGVRAQPGSPAPAEQAGAISGQLGYPSEFLPGQAIYALSVDLKSYYKVESVSYQGRYTMVGVPAGDYFVYAVARWGTAQQRFGAGYTKAIACGLSVSCTDHAPLTVHVERSQTTTGIDPIDWYADPGQYPLIPDGPTSVASPQPATFDSSESASRSLAETRLISRYVANQADCQANQACSWFVSIVNGHNASYVVAYSGSNADLIRCGLYVVHEGDIWRQLDVRCTEAAKGVSPALHERGHVQLGMGETGCVRVHTTPGITARVVNCLKPGTTALIDGGPYYLPTKASKPPDGPSQADLWWHLSGYGWMVHQYLYSS